MSHPKSTSAKCKHFTRNAIQFKMLNNNDILSLSSTVVDHSELYVNTDEAYECGPLDSRLGTSQKSKKCGTCNKDFFQCPGHFGHIDLALPLFNHGFFKQILTVLQIVCKYCSRILVPDEIRDNYMQKMCKFKSDSRARRTLYEKLIKECKKIHKCPNCCEINGVVKKMEKNPQKIVHDRLSISEEESAANIEDLPENSLKQYEEIDPLKALKIFSNITNSDILLMDIDPQINRPEHMIITKLPVPPACIRPSVSMGDERTNEDDLTIKIGEIISINNTIKAFIEKGTPVNKMIESWMMMQYLVTQYINSDAPGLPFNLIGSNSTGICQRLKGKHGRFRGNLSGKRVDFSGRTVISPDPNLKINEVGVPKLMAVDLTYPERVTNYNIDHLRSCIINGPHKHPGANFVISGDFKVYLGAGNRRAIAEQLKIGDVVERHLDNGDLVLFNRQPSLHRISIMAFNAKILPWKTLRFNVCDCAPFNADFDGDEMNLHFPQCEEARAELKELMFVRNNLVSPKNGEPIIACMQDFLTTSYLITQKDRFFDRANFWKVCGYFAAANERIDIPPPAIVKPIELWTGKQVISVLMKPNKYVNIQINCELKEKNYSGKGKQMCINDGWVIVKNSQLLCGNLCKPSIGASSKAGIIYSLLTENGVNAAAEFMQRFAKLTSLWLRNYGMSIGLNDVTPFDRLLQEQAKLVKSSYKACEEFIKLYNDGSIKTRPGCNAEQSLEGYINSELSKIRDKAGDLLKDNLPKSNPALIMMICGSKGSNLNLCQMIACVGQQTVNGERIPNGFLNRSLPHFDRFSKTPEAKGFVSNSFYSGLTASEYFFHTMGGREGLVDTAVKTANSGYMQRRLMKAMEDLYTSYDYSVRTCSNDIIEFLYGDDGFDSMKIEGDNMPVNYNKLIDHTKSKFRSEGTEPIQKSSVENIDISGLPEHTERMKSALTNTLLAQCQQNLIKGSSSITMPECLTERQLKCFIEEMKLKLQSSRVHPGEAVGAQAAMSIGEPTTQMTLKTFHFAGVASMNVTLGVPRVIEIINAIKDISTPIITVVLENNNDVRAARIVKGRIEKAVLSDVCTCIKEVYKPNGCYLVAVVDVSTIEKLGLEITMDSIKAAIIAHSKPKIKEQHISIKKHKIIITPTEKSKDKLYFSMQLLKSMLPHIIIAGIPTVGRAIINREDSTKVVVYNLFLEGVGLKQVFKIPGVDPFHTKTNHIIETEEVLGIEAARSVIIQQIKYIMTEYSIAVDPRHMNLLADTMCCKGKVLGITRFGISRMKNSVLMQASFEKTIDHLFEAAGHTSYDCLEGVSERIILVMI